MTHVQAVRASILGGNGTRFSGQEAEGGDSVAEIAQATGIPVDKLNSMTGAEFVAEYRRRAATNPQQPFVGMQLHGRVLKAIEADPQAANHPMSQFLRSKGSK